MFDPGGIVISWFERLSTPPEIQKPKPGLSPSEVASKVVFCFIVAWLAQFLLIGMFNLTNHALADFPGPRLAAFTEWYKTYRELVCKESWVHVLAELHNKHGNIVRVGPNEISFSDPAAYFEIYNNTALWDKEPTLYQSFGEAQSTFGLLKYKDSKKRKDLLSPLFSRAAISDLQSLVQSNVDRFCDVLANNNEAGKPSGFFLGLRCFAVDTIMSFYFAKSMDTLGEPDFKAPVVEAMEVSSNRLLLFKHFPLLRTVLSIMPESIMARMLPQSSAISKVLNVISTQVEQLRANSSGLRKFPHPIVIEKLLIKSGNNTEKALNQQILLHEAQSLLFGGTDAVSSQMMLGIWHLLKTPRNMRRLKEELLQAWPVLEDTPKFEDLEKLPFLTAVIKESLRIGPGGIPGVLSRVIPTKGITISGSIIPKETIVGMSSYSVHHSESIFKNPESFDPHRWLDAGSASLDKWLVPFSKGPRSCLGINLAFCEFYLMFGAVFRRFDLELDETCGDIEDLKWTDPFMARFSGPQLRIFCKPSSS